MPRTVKPVIYLDFDGVLNAVSLETHRLHHVTGFTGYRRTRVGYSTATWSPEVMKRLKSLQQLAEIRWLTTWRSDTARIEEELPVQLDGWFDFENESLNHSGKLEAILADQADRPRPFIWVDDEEHRYYHCADQYGYVLSALTEHLLIQPSTFAGLTTDDFDRMEAFLARHGGSR